MAIRMLQMFTISIYLLLVTRTTTAVVNNGATAKSSLESSTSTAETKDTSSEIASDSRGASSETEANKREAIIELTENFATAGILDGIYGPPIDSYLTSSNSINLPVPVYGVPNTGPNLIYPTPPPDIPPPLPSVSLTYALPNAGIKDIYGPPKFSYTSIKSKPIRTKYGVPFIQRPPKPLITSNFHIPKGPKPVYGPPRFLKPNFNKIPKLQYGPPKPQYGPPPKLAYGPPKQVQIQTATVYIPPSGGPLLNPQISGAILNPPPIAPTYGPPKIQPAQQYGPPEPVIHGPPHPGIPAPPTPPDIKYDGWQPIPGLVSRPPSDIYGVPNQGGHDVNDLQIIPGLVSRPPSDIYGVPNQGGHDVNDLQISTGFILPPPAAGGDAGVHSLSLQENFKGNGAISDSYGAPLNTVTGSGGVVASSGEEHHQQSQGGLDILVNNQEQHNHQSNINVGLSAIGVGGQDNSLSVIKSVGYQLFPNYGLGYSGAYPNGATDTYGAPPINSYSQAGPYPAASYKTSSTAGFGSAFNSYNFGKEISLSPTGVGLIPPSGVYGATPNSQYGTPLFQPANQHFHGAGQKYHQPRKPVVFREPVPVGLIQSIGNIVNQKDASGIIDTIHSNSVGPTYLPPPVPEVTKPVKEAVTPSGLYSLPHVERPISFQNVVHGSPTAGLSHQLSNSLNLNAAGGDYNFGSIDGAYALPLQTTGVGFNTNQNHNQQNYYVDSSRQVNFNQDYNSYSLQNLEPYHDCNTPQLGYNLPSGIGGGYQGQNSYIVGAGTDLQTSHSQSTASLSSTSSNSVSEVTKDSYAKSLGETFANGGDVVKSQSLDLNNIPIQGALGTYTLQIQSADGLGGGSSSSANIPHEQVLNDGLLQSILAAIEQPQQKQQIQLQAQHDQSQIYSQIANVPADLVQNQRSDEDARGEQSVKNALILTAPVEVGGPSYLNGTEGGRNDFGDHGLIDNNEIALYFNNTNIQQQSVDLESEEDVSSDAGDVKNAQQYGSSFVSFKTPSASYSYGEVRGDSAQGQDKGSNDRADQRDQDLDQGQDRGV
ncbi:hypothetical protein QE152_g4659 [Popillia japonica]|uniref:Uncharacterized protein n=1 Tax=Popillia japonica TaxID=7064 RepID=A0AAW1N1J8_POPJA